MYLRWSCFALRALAALMVAGLSTLPLLATAQDDLDDTIVLSEPPPAPAGTVSCFDYYRFGSVQAKVTAPIASTVSGATITFSGTLDNANAYPIVDGTLYVKIFKARGEANDGNGPDVVDQFFVKDGIAIPGNGSVPISFTWQVPAFAVSGEYSLATYFTTSHKFNLLGLSFTDDIAGNVVPFTVVGEQEARVSFEKAGVGVNGLRYYFASFSPRVGSGPATVQAMVRNTSGTPEQARVHWKVYQWDAQSEANLVQESEANVSVPARGAAPVSVIVNDAQHPVYLAVGELTWRDTKSVIGVRFVREGIDKLRINFPGITSFPLRSGSEASLFSCLHNTGVNAAPGGRLELSLADKWGKTIATHSYTGDVTGAMMGVASPFTPSKDYEYATLNAKLYQGDVLVDEASVVYDCKTIDPSECTPSLLDRLLSDPRTAFVGGTALFLLLVGLLLVVVWLRRRVSLPPEPNPPTV